MPDVTLVAVASVAIEHTLSALLASAAQVEFGQILLLSDREPARLPPSLEWRPIDRLNSRAEYSRFMLSKLAGHVATSHALCVQWDGYVLDGAAWRPEFLDYDYIGAVWPHVLDHYNVGNGGFSLRSRRLLEACSALPSGAVEAEDVLIGRRFRARLEEQGLRFAPADVARQFSYERTAPTGREFGFHGAFNLVRYLSPQQRVALFGSLEPELLARNEHWDLLRWAVSRGQFRLAGVILRRMI